MDDSGQLTIKCSRDYFSLDCGITAYELSDYSPSDDPEGQGQGQGHGRGSEPRSLYPELERDLPELLQSVDLLTIAAKQLSSSKQNLGGGETTNGTTTAGEQPSTSTEGLRSPPRTLSDSGGDSASSPPPPSTVNIMQGGTPQGESALSKRPLQGSYSNKVSPTQPSLPKRAMFLEGGDDNDPKVQRSALLHNTLQFQADISRSTPSLLDPPDRSKFWLDLDSVYPSNARHSYESLDAMNRRNLQASRDRAYQRPPIPGAAHIPLQRSTSEAGQGAEPKSDPIPQTSAVYKDRAPQTGQGGTTHTDSESPLPTSPELNPSDFDRCEEDLSLSSSPEVPPASSRKTSLIAPKVSQADPSPTSNRNEDHWYGSDEFLALPAQLKKTEMLTMNLESLAKALPPRHSQEETHIQDVDDWDLTEAVNQDWEGASSSGGSSSGGGICGSCSPQPSLLSALCYKKPYLGRLSPTSSSDIAPSSMDESIESGPLSDLLSEDEVGWGAPMEKSSSTRRRRSGVRGRFATPSPAPSLEAQCKPVIQHLLEDIQHQDNYQEIWGKIEVITLISSMISCVCLFYVFICAFIDDRIGQ